MNVALACAILLIVGIFSIELFLVPYVDVPKNELNIELPMAQPGVFESSTVYENEDGSYRVEIDGISNGK